MGYGSKILEKQPSTESLEVRRLGCRIRFGIGCASKDKGIDRITKFYNEVKTNMERENCLVNQPTTSNGPNDTEIKELNFHIFALRSKTRGF